MNRWTESPDAVPSRPRAAGAAAPTLLRPRTVGGTSTRLIALMLALLGGCRREGTHVTPDLAAQTVTPRPSTPASPASPASLTSLASPASLAPATPTPPEQAPLVAAPPEANRDWSATRQLALSPGRRSVRSRAGIIVSVSDEATRKGLAILESGGNAVDAAVAVALVLAVTHPSAGNLGGGGFALVRLERGSIVALDFRESSPHGLDRARFSSMLRRGGEGPDSVAVPGSVAGLYELWSRYGRLSFGEVVAPARRLAEAGHRVSPREAIAIRTAWPKIKHHPRFRKLYGTADGVPLAESALLRLPELAETLRAIEGGGMNGFYSGEVAESIVRELGPNAQISLRDLEGYRAIWREPVVVPYRGVRVVMMPPPSAGGVALAASLAMLSHFDPAKLQRGSGTHAHVLLEVMRRAQVDRIFNVVDPDTLSVSERSSTLANLLDPERWLRRHPIDLLHATPNDEILAGVDLPPEPEHTTHLAVVDARGLAVSLTTTLSSGFGAKEITASGIVLNNALASFSGAGQNQPRPDRRTTSSMAPTMVEDSQGLRLVLGTPGGDTIPSTLLMLVNSLIDYGVALDVAIDAPRMHQDVGTRGLARLEGKHPIAGRLQRELERLGHHFCRPTYAMGHANTIALIDGYLYGYADPREGGLAQGQNL